MKSLSEKPVIFFLNPGEVATRTLRIDLNYYHPKYMRTIEFIEEAAKYYDVKQLGEIAEITRILGFEADRFVKYVNEGIPYLRVQNVKEFEIDLKGVMYISKEAHEALKRSQLKPNDVVITTTGRVGTTAVIPKTIGECNASQEILRIRIQNKAVSPDYIAAYLNAGFGKKLFKRLDSGSTRPRTLIKNVRNIPIIIPDQEKQTQIVDRIKLLKRRKNDALIEAESLSKKARKIQQDSYLLVYKILGIKTQHAEPEKVFLLTIDKLEDRLDVAYYSGANKYRLQSQFPVEHMVELVEFSQETTIPETEPLHKFAYIQIHDVDAESGKILSHTEILGRAAPSRARRIVKEGDIISALTRARGSTAIVPRELDGSLASTAFAVLKPKQNINSFFLYFMLRSSYVLNEIQRRLAGVATPAINLSEFKAIKLPIPPPQSQEEIVNMLRKAKENSENTRKQAEALIEEARELDQVAENEFVASLSREKD